MDIIKELTEAFTTSQDPDGERYIPENKRRLIYRVELLIQENNERLNRIHVLNLAIVNRFVSENFKVD